MLIAFPLIQLHIFYIEYYRFGNLQVFCYLDAIESQNALWENIPKQHEQNILDELCKA